MLSSLRYTLCVLAAPCVMMFLACAADAAELVMYRRDGCPWCAKWDREVGPIYPKTEFSSRAPLRMINLDHDQDLPISYGPILYTPTFVLVAGSREIGRIEGYPGDEFFWVRLASLLEKLPASESMPKPSPRQGRPGDLSMARSEPPR
jgi:hypothetical protein